MGKIKIHNSTPLDVENYLEVPKSDRTRDKIEIVGEKLLKCLTKEDFCLYYCPGFNARVYYYNPEHKNTISRIINLS